MRGTPQLLEEAMEKHRKVKAMMLKLLEKANMANTFKTKIQDELFLIYQELK